MSVDEYEVLRLIDKESLSQEQTSQLLEVGRTTVQQIYNSARKKLAECLVDGKKLKIGGGAYQLCNGDNKSICHNCHKRKHDCHIPKYKEKSSMKILLPLDYDGSSVCVSFARAPQFLIKDTSTGNVQILDNPACEEEHGAGIKASQFVLDQNIDIVITPRLGENSAKVFEQAGIEIFKSIKANALDNALAWEQNQLEKLTHFHTGFQGIQQ